MFIVPFAGLPNQGWVVVCVSVDQNQTMAARLTGGEMQSLRKRTVSDFVDPLY